MSPGVVLCIGLLDGIVLDKDESSLELAMPLLVKSRDPFSDKKEDRPHPLSLGAGI